jgi:hypothetical protein
MMVTSEIIMAIRPVIHGIIDQCDQYGISGNGGDWLG